MDKRTCAFGLLAILMGTLLSSLFIDNPEPNTLELNLIETKVLESGDSLIHGFVYYNDSLWASTRTSPCRILKIDTETLDYQRIILSPGFDDGEALIAANGSIWVILCSSPTRVIKINPSTLEWETAVELKEVGRGHSLSYAFDFLWAGCEGKMAKINLETLEYEIYDYAEIIGDTQFHALTVGGGYIWGSCPQLGFLSLGFNPATTILRINPDDPTEYNQTVIYEIVTDDMVYSNNNLYLGTESPFASSKIYKILNDLTSTQGIDRNAKCYGVFSQNKNTLWGAYTGKPGRIIEFNSELEIEGLFCLPQGFNDANEIVFDQEENIYITCFESPAKIVKLTHPDLQAS